MRARNASIRASIFRPSIRSEKRRIIGPQPARRQAAGRVADPHRFFPTPRAGVRRP
ncbi:conserved hypothetical protein [Burkholderia multivorans CGD1]|nr:conserved hypothetical protein [Burkholderia multivorans CGD1]